MLKTSSKYKKQAPSEAKIQHDILETLYKIPQSKVLRYNSVPVYDEKLKTYRKQSHKWNPDGVSDILFFWSGKAFAIEVKKESEYRWLRCNYDRLLSVVPKVKKDIHFKNQIVFILDFIKSGNRGFFTYSVDHCLKKIGV